MVELHHFVFQYFKELLLRWYTGEAEAASEKKSTVRPQYKHAGTGEVLTYETLQTLFAEGTKEDQYNSFFPNLTEDNWKEELKKKGFSLNEMPWQLKIETVSGYNQDCFFCDNSKCRSSCPLPFNSKMTVFDLLQKLNVEDNVSYYNHGKGRKDITLGLVWSKDFLDDIQKLLSSVDPMKALEG